MSFVADKNEAGRAGQRPPPRAPAWLVGRDYFGMSAFVAACGAWLIWLPTQLADSARLVLAAGMLGYSLLCLVALWASRWPRFAIQAGLSVTTLAAVALSGAIDFALGDGVRGTTSDLCAVAICTVCAIAGLRWGLPLALAALLQAAILAALEYRGFMAPHSGTPILVALAFRALAIGAGLVGGALIARLIKYYVGTAVEREERFHSLLNIAADWYWEQDELFRYSLISSADVGTQRTATVTAPADWLQRTLWQIPETRLSEEQIDAHRAALESHLPFSGLLVQRRDEQGRWRIESLSGAPKFGPGPNDFAGYWGVARDVTDQMAAQRSVEASETRYRELFRRSPSPIFLHRRGLIFDANAAAARLFGFASAAAMSGFDSMAFFAPGQARERALRRLAEIESLPVGEGLPVMDLQVHSIDGRSLRLQSSAVRVDTPSGSAGLSIFFDITAREAVEGALRRSEAMLTHLFATSPDSIALSDRASGHYTMVNPAFCRLTGFSAEQVVGRTAAEIGLWHDPRDDARMAERLDEGGTVTDWPAVFVSKSGALVSVLLSVGRFMMDRRDYLVVNARDVTASERTRLEHAAILDRASIGIAFTRDRRFVQANPYFEAMFGWPSGGLLGQPGSAVWSHTPVGGGGIGDEESGGGGIGSGEVGSGEVGSGEVGGGESGGGGMDDGESGAGDMGDGKAGGAATVTAAADHAGDDADIDELAWPLLAQGKPFEIERQMRRRTDQRFFWCRLRARAVDPGEPKLGGTIWIAEDVTEQRRLDQALAAARDAAEAASAAKSAFLANTSHEIRTPLNGLLGLARLALRPDLGEAKRIEYVAQILDSAQGLAGIMSDILDLSKIEAGKLALDSLPFDLCECLRAVHHAYQPLAESKGVELRLELDPGLPTTVFGDPVRLRQILSNFVTNALKFTERGEIVLAAGRAPGSSAADIRLAVSDTGPGIAASVQARLFTPFSQGDSSITRRYGGTGLGLSICRELARLMGGRVGVSSEPGQGSTFWAELPLPSIEAAAAPAAESSSAEAAELAELSGKRVLLVEDNPVNMMIGVAMLEHWGIDVAQAVDGRMAVDAVHEAAGTGEPFDAVLMDVQMPIMSGHEAARELRRTFGSQVLPIIALTAAALVSERDEALQAGMDEFLTKPIDAAQLRQVLARRVAG